MKNLFLKIFLAILLCYASTAKADSYTVTKTADTNDGSCSSTDCSLREAIVAANASTATPHTISFSIPTSDTGCASSVCTISPTSAMTSLTRGSTTINGYSQSGASANTATFPSALNGTLTISLKGTSAGSTVSGLTIASSSNVIKGLVVKSFGKFGIYITAAGTSNKIQGCYLGVESTGETKAANTNANIYVAGSSNIIGTDGDGSDDASERNLISGSAANGITLASNSNRVSGNFIGTDKDGDTDLGNTAYGIAITLDSNTIGTNSDGTSDSVEGNVIAGNDSYGIYLYTTADGNVIAGNTIGTNAAETSALANKNGIYVAGNTTKIGVNTNGSSGADEGNIISGNTTTGIQINNGTGTVIAGNKIGTNGDGNAAIANRTYGILIVKGANRIGTDGDGSNDNAEGNLISGNTYSGIYLYSTTSGNTIAGNVIGTGTDLTTDLGNGGHGIYLYNSTVNNIMGGDSDVESNLIAYNGDVNSEYGIYATGTSTDGNQILRNKIYQNHGTEIKLNTGANNDKAAPTISADSSGTISGTATAGDTVLIFDASSDSGSEAYAGQATADSTGAWSTAIDSTYNTNSNTLVATATDTTNGTSQFSSIYTIANAAAAPVASDASVTTNEDTAITIALSATDADSTSLTYSTGTSPTHGTLSTPSAMGSVTYTPNADYSEGDSFTFTASDGSLTSNIATVTITIDAVADAPRVDTAPTARLDEDTSTTITLTATDPDSTTLTYSITTSPTNGSVTSPDASANVTYTPNTDYNGSDSFTYSVSDGALSTTATVAITVDPVDEPNTAPTAGNVTVYASNGFSAEFTLDGADADTGDTLTYSYSGTSSLAGSLTGTAPDLAYEPSGIMLSSESFTYTVTDVAGATATGTVTIAPAAEAIHIGAGGFLTRLYQDPTDPDSCWATSDLGGLFMSEDSCQTFKPKNNSFERTDHLFVDDVLVDPSDGTGNTVYAFSGTYTLGTSPYTNYPLSYGCCLWKSTDRGENFSPIFRKSSGGGCNYSTTYGYNSCSSRGTKGTAYLRQDGRKEERIYHTDSYYNSQLSVRRMTDGKRLAFDPSTCTGASCTTVFAADFEKGVYKSEDSGATFAQLPLPPIVAGTSMRVSSINLLPYTSGGATEHLILVGARKAHLGGKSIKSTANTYGNGALYLGFNGGEAEDDWVTITLPSSSISDVLDIAIASTLDLGTADANDVIHYAAGKAGIVKGEFTAIDTTTPSATMSFSYAANYCGSGTVAYGSTGTAVAASGSYGTGLGLESRCDYSDGTSTYVAVEIDPDNDNNLYAVTSSQDNEEIYHSTDGGTNWSTVTNSSDYSNFDFNDVWFDQHKWKIASFAGTITFVGRDENGNTSSGGSAVAFSDFWTTWKTPNDGSNNFTAYYQGIEDVVFQDIAADPFDSDRFYLGVSDHTLFLSEDGGKTTTLRGGGPDTPYPDDSGITGGLGIGTTIAFSNTESASGYADSVFVGANNITTAGGGLFESSDGGKTWTDIGATTSLPSGNVKAITFDASNNRLYVALSSNDDLFESDDDGVNDGVNDGDPSYAGLYCIEKSGSTWGSATLISAVNTAIGLSASDGEYIFDQSSELSYHSASGKLFILHNANSTATDLSNYRKLLSYTPGTTCSNGTATVITPSRTSTSSCSAPTCIPDGTLPAQPLSFAVDPSDTNKIYLGMYRVGLWYTADGGTSWTRYYFDPDSTDATSASSSYYSRSINDVLIHPSDPNIIILGSKTNYYDNSSASYYGVKADVILANTSYYDTGVVIYNASTGVYTDVTSLLSPFGRAVSSLHIDTNEPYRLLVGTSGQGGMTLHLDNIIDWTGTALE